jgi:uncharacterized protein (UPF0333 family)
LFEGGDDVKKKGQTAVEYLLLVGTVVTFVTVIAYFVKTRVVGGG